MKIYIFKVLMKILGYQHIIWNVSIKPNGDRVEIKAKENQKLLNALVLDNEF